METVYTSSWLNRLHSLSSRIVMPLMAVLFICTNTVINLWIDERIETIQNIIAIMVLMIVASYLLSAPRERLCPWIKSNILVIAYFIVRLISLWQCGFDYSVIRTICFEMFFHRYLWIYGRFKVRKSFLCKIFRMVRSDSNGFMCGDFSADASSGIGNTRCYNQVFIL